MIKLLSKGGNSMIIILVIIVSIILLFIYCSMHLASICDGDYEEDETTQDDTTSILIYND